QRPEPPGSGLDLFGVDVLAPPEAVGDAGPGPLGGRGVGLDQHHVAARFQQHLGDAGAHGAATDHGGATALSPVVHTPDPATTWPEAAKTPPAAWPRRPRRPGGRSGSRPSRDARRSRPHDRATTPPPRARRWPGRPG